MNDLETLHDTFLRRNFVILDTETTGLGFGSEIIEIAIVSMAGVAVVNTRICPVNGIPASATAIHGITERDVHAAPTWPLVRSQVARARHVR